MSETQYRKRLYVEPAPGQHSEGTLELWTSNSFRRFGIFGGPPICEPITQNDGHPDLYFRNGGPEGPDARRITACWNACIGLPTDTLENGVKDSVQGLASRLAGAQLANVQLLAALRSIKRKATGARLTHSRDISDWAEDISSIEDEASALLARFPKEEGAQP